MIPPAPAPRLVLDTNVVLDLYLFRDRGVADLLRLLEDGRAVGTTSEACVAELDHVLGREPWMLDAARRASLIGAYLRLVRMAPAGPSSAPTTLPRCKDPDDQKFLELARDAAADFLVTKDKALLRLRRGKHGVRAFRIVTPSQLLETLRGSGL